MEQAEFPPLGNKPLWQQVHDVLERMIIHREIKPGIKLHERELSERFGVSRGPIRQALLALQKDGWVEVRHHQGTYVRNPGKAEAHQLFEIRRILEPEAAAMAAQRASDEDVAELQEIVDEGFRALEDENVDEAIRLNTRFHRAICEITGNMLLAGLMDGLEKRVIWFLSAVMPFRGQESWPEHQELVEAIEAKDPEKASEIMARHTNATYEAYVNTVGAEATEDETEKTVQGSV